MLPFYFGKQIWIGNNRLWKSRTVELLSIIIDEGTKIWWILKQCLHESIGSPMSTQEVIHINPYWPNASFGTPWKHQKFLRFSVVFRGSWKGALAPYVLKKIKKYLDFKNIRIPCKGTFEAQFKKRVGNGWG